MGTVIDELVVELKLDPKQFDQAQKDQVKKLREFEREHERHSKKIAKDTDQLTQAFTLLQGRLLAIAGLFMGGMGITQFTEHVAKLTAQTGYLATSLGMSTSEITRWQAVGALRGASPGEMSQSIASVRNAISDLRNGRPTEMQKFSYMTAQKGQGPFVDLRPETNETDFMVDVARWLEAQKRKGPAAYAAGNRAVSTMLGFGQGTINTLDMGPDELRKRLKEMEKYAPSKEQVEKFQRLQASLAEASTAAERLGRSIAEFMTPALIRFTDWLTKLINIFNDKGVGAGAAEIESEAQRNTAGFGYYGAKNAAKSIYHWGRRKLGLDPEESPSTPPGAVGGGTPSASGAANDNVGAGLGGSDFLRARRERFSKELSANPALKNRLAAIIDLENPRAGTAVAESLFNRMDYSGGSVASGIRGGPRSFYGPARNPGMVEGRESELMRHPERLRARLRQIDEALAGSNLIQGYTDQGSAGDPNYYAGGVGVNINRERFNYWGGGPGGHAGAMRYRKMIMEGVNRENSAPAAGSFDTLWNSRIGSLGGARSAMRSGAGVVNNNNRSSETHIGNMNVTVPPGADPAGYARGISQELQRYDNVMRANEGIL